jgi:hypothetical protein
MWLQTQRRRRRACQLVFDACWISSECGVLHAAQETAQAAPSPLVFVGLTLVGVGALCMRASERASVFVRARARARMCVV